MTAGAAVGPSSGVDIAVLYIWIIAYGALFFSPAVTLA